MFGYAPACLFLSRFFNLNIPRKRTFVGQKLLTMWQLHWRVVRYGALKEAFTHATRPGCERTASTVKGKHLIFSEVRCMEALTLITREPSMAGI